MATNKRKKKCSVSNAVESDNREWLERVSWKSRVAEVKTQPSPISDELIEGSTAFVNMNIQNDDDNPNNRKTKKKKKKKKKKKENGKINELVLEANFGNTVKHGSGGDNYFSPTSMELNCTKSNKADNIQSDLNRAGMQFDICCNSDDGKCLKRKKNKATSSRKKEIPNMFGNGNRLTYKAAEEKEICSEDMDVDCTSEPSDQLNCINLSFSVPELQKTARVAATEFRTDENKPSSKRKKRVPMAMCDKIANGEGYDACCFGPCLSVKSVDNGYDAKREQIWKNTQDNFCDREQHFGRRRLINTTGRCWEKDIGDLDATRISETYIDLKVKTDSFAASEPYEVKQAATAETIAEDPFLKFAYTGELMKVSHDRKNLKVQVGSSHVDEIVEGKNIMDDSMIRNSISNKDYCLINGLGDNEGQKTISTEKNESTPLRLPEKAPSKKTKRNANQEQITEKQPMRIVSPYFGHSAGQNGVISNENCASIKLWRHHMNNTKVLKTSPYFRNVSDDADVQMSRNELPSTTVKSVKKSSSHNKSTSQVIKVSPYFNNVSTLLSDEMSSKERKAKSPQLSAAQKRSEPYCRKTPDNPWVPPRSPFLLLQEDHAQDPWRILVICMLLNCTTGLQARRVIPTLFDLCPNAEVATTVATEDIEKVIQSLGLQKKRALMIQRMSEEYLEETWTHVTQLHGVGK